MRTETTFTKAEFAKLVGLSTRSIEKAVEGQKVTPLQMRPMLFTIEEVAKFIKMRLDEAQCKEKDQIAKDKELSKLDGEARIKQAKAEIEEMKLEELRGSLHAAEDVKAIVTDHALYIRSMLLAMPGKLAVDVANITTAAEAADRIKREVYYILNCAADYQYDPEEYAKRVREREGWKEMDVERDD